eukprot:s1776_g9.t1
MCQPLAGAAPEAEGLGDDSQDDDAFEGTVRHHGRLVFVKLSDETGAEFDVVFDWRFFDHEKSPRPFPSKSEFKAGDRLIGQLGLPSGFWAQLRFGV